MEFKFTFGENYFPNYKWNWEEMSSMERGLCIKKQQDEILELLNTKISLIPSCSQSNKIKISTVGQALETMATSKSLERFKEMAGWKYSDDEKKKETFARMKITAAPAMTISTYAERGESLKEASNFPKNPYIAVDIDYKSLDDITEENFNKINSLPFVLGSSVSISGLGFWSIVKLDITDITDKEGWQQMYYQLYSYYKEQGIEIDKACCNINRLRCFSPYCFHWNKKYIAEFVPEIKDDFQASSITEEKKQHYSIDNFVITGYSTSYREPYVKGEMHMKRLIWANTIANLYGAEGKKLYFDIFSEDKNVGNDLEVQWEWCLEHRGEYESSSSCISKLMEMLLIEGKREEVTANCDKKLKSLDF